MKIKLSNLFFLSAIVFFAGCTKEATISEVQYDDTPYLLDIGRFPAPQLPEDNKLTNAKVALGKLLFFEKKLSKDNSQSCASCHVQKNGFSDINKFSVGVEGLEGKRQAMAIFNMAWHENEFFWDGRANLLRDQALMPIEDPLEMNETLENVISKLRELDLYKNSFKRAFGSEEITSEKMALAMEQFMLTIISNDSKYDKYLAGEVQLSESEMRGKILFETEYNPFFPDQSGADCVHCHGGPNFENDQYMNNGLDTDAEIKDIGREEVTGNAEDRGKFKVTSLRNIAVTPPYMHDGRFTTLEEVIDHYNTGIKESSTVDPAILFTKQTGLMLTDQDKQDLIAFLNTLTDESFLNSDAFLDPFEN